MPCSATVAGGRVAIQVGLDHPDRIRRLRLLPPSLAWPRGRPWAPLLKLVAPQLGLVQPTPRLEDPARTHDALLGFFAGS